MFVLLLSDDRNIFYNKLGSSEQGNEYATSHGRLPHELQQVNLVRNKQPPEVVNMSRSNSRQQTANKRVEDDDCEWPLVVGFDLSRREK